MSAKRETRNHHVSEALIECQRKSVVLLHTARNNQNMLKYVCIVVCLFASSFRMCFCGICYLLFVNCASHFYSFSFDFIDDDVQTRMKERLREPYACSNSNNTHTLIQFKFAIVCKSVLACLGILSQFNMRVFKFSVPLERE